MLKFLGAICVMLATIGYTGYLLENQKLHRNALQSLISMAELLVGYINHERLTMEEAFARLSGRHSSALHSGANGAFHSVLARITDRLTAGTDESFELVWREVFCAEAPNMLLSEEELSIILDMGKNLGSADIETQIRCLQGGARRLEKKLSEAERELAEKRRLFRYLGVAVGAMVVLVLI